MDNKIPDASNLVSEINYDAKIKDIESKYFTTSNYHKFMNVITDNMIKEKGLAKNSKFMSNSDLVKKIAPLVAKAELKSQQYKFKHLIQVIFFGKSHFEDDVTKNYLLFQEIYKYLGNRVSVIWLAIAFIFQCGEHVKYKACKINEYLGIKICSCEKRLFGKLILACLLNDKKVICKKINCLIQTISLVIICPLLVAVICVSFFFYYTKYQSKKKKRFNAISWHQKEIKKNSY